MIKPGTLRTNVLVSETHRECDPLCSAESSSDKSSKQSLWRAERERNTHKVNRLTLYQEWWSLNGFYRGCGGRADFTWGSWDGLMMLPCLSMTRYTGIPEMTLGSMNSRWSTNSADAPGNCGFSSDESKGCCRCTAWHVEYKHYLLITSLWLWQWKPSIKDTTKRDSSFSKQWHPRGEKNLHWSLMTEWKTLHNVILQKMTSEEIGYISCFKKFLWE